MLALMTCLACSPVTQGNPKIALPDRELVCTPELGKQLADRVTTISGQSGPIEIHISENELCSLVCSSISAMPDLQLWITAQGLAFSSQLGNSDRFRIAGEIHVSVRDETLYLLALELWLNSQRVPGLLAKAVQAAANAALADMRSPLRFEQLTLSEGSAVIEGTIN